MSLIKLNNTEAQMLDTIYFVTQIYFKLHFLRENKDNMVKILSYFTVIHEMLISSMTRRALMMIHCPVIQILYSNISVCSALGFS